VLQAFPRKVTHEGGDSETHCLRTRIGNGKELCPHWWDAKGKKMHSKKTTNENALLLPIIVKAWGSESVNLGFTYGRIAE